MLEELQGILKLLDIHDTDPSDIVKHIIIYLRKSRKDSEFFKEESIEKTLERHEQILQQYITNIFGVPIPQENIFREVASGDTITDRPIMQKVLLEVENPSIKGLLCIEPERLGRGDGMDQSLIIKTLRLTNTKFLTPMKIFNLEDENDLTFLEDSLYQSRKYLVYTKRILKRGRSTSALFGKWPYSIAPFGYNRQKIQGEKGYYLIRNELEFGIGQMIGLLYIKGIHFNYTIMQDDSINTIARKFGIPVKQLIKDNETVDFKVNNKLTINIDDARCSTIANYLNYLNLKPRMAKEWTQNIVRGILFGEAGHGYVTFDKRKTITTIKSGEEHKSRPISKKFIRVKGIHEPLFDENLSKLIFQKKETCSTQVVHVEQTKNQLSGLVICSVCGNKMQRRDYSYVASKKKMLSKDDKIKILNFLRQAKENAKLSLRDISLATKINKNTIDHYFAKNLKKFSMPTESNWEKICNVLNIENKELTQLIQLYFQKEDYVHVDTLICNRAHCATVASDLNLVEKKILLGLQEILKEYTKFINDYKKSSTNKQSVDNNLATIDILNKEIEKNKQQLEKACELVENCIYSKETYISRTVKINLSIKELEQKIKDLKTKSNTKERKITQYKKAIPILENVVKEYYKIENAANRNALLRSIIDKVVYEKKVGGLYYKESFKITIYLKIL